MRYLMYVANLCDNLLKNANNQVRINALLFIAKYFQYSSWKYDAKLQFICPMVCIKPVHLFCS